MKTNKVTTIKESKSSVFGKPIARLLVDPWIVMITAGALGAQIHNNFMMHISFWQSWLACMLLQAIYPVGDSTSLEVMPAETEKKDAV